MERYNKILKNEDFLSAVDAIEKDEEKRIYCKHGIDHLLDTARVAYIIVLENKMNIDKDIIYAAALLHDTGRAVSAAEHNKESRKIAEKILPECGYNTDETDEICRAIEVHRKDTDKLENLSDVLTMADHLSRKCYMCKAVESCYWSEERKNSDIVY